MLKTYPLKNYNTLLKEIKEDVKNKEIFHVHR